MSFDSTGNRAIRISWLVDGRNNLLSAVVGRRTANFLAFRGIPARARIYE